MTTHSALIQQDIESYLQLHEQKDLLRFITCGNVDDGKSTLIGRLLHDSQSVYEDQLAAITNTNSSSGSNEVDLALLVDGLQSEREQGITIDVAYRFFSSQKRKFIIADTPGHEQYTRNMATGASSAQLAILLIDARYGVKEQTRRHSFICSLLGIRHFVVAINKMDLVSYREEVFQSIKSDFKNLAEQHFDEVECQFVPLSALSGDNVVNRSSKMDWYQGPTLLSILESVDIAPSTEVGGLRLPVQYVNRPNLDFRGYCGTLAAGQVKVGEAIKVLPSGQKSTVKEILVGDQYTENAQTGQAITLTLSDEIDISRGDLIVSDSDAVNVSNDFNAKIVWMNSDALVPDRQYRFKIGTRYVNGYVKSIHWQQNVNSLDRTETDNLPLNGIGEAHIVLAEKVSFDRYQDNRSTGSLIIIDRLSNATVGAGMISGPANQAANDDINVSTLKSVDSSVTTAMRAALKNHSGKCVWVSNTALGEQLEWELHKQGFHTYLIEANQSEYLTVLTLIDAGLIVITTGSDTLHTKLSQFLPDHQWINLNRQVLTEKLQQEITKLCRK
ncbi:sulfate adenylyltransferase subunit CysN [Porticoccaceae bacterium LTM1]|nr:sulfate adenylyltransferase subunit CysN [Porticoccaceae bacterium LTM1]